jgi:hypothetical protein
MFLRLTASSRGWSAPPPEPDAAAGMRPVVRLSDIVRGARLRREVLGAHQPVKNDTQSKVHYSAFYRSLDSALDVVSQLLH